MGRGAQSADPKCVEKEVGENSIVQEGTSLENGEPVAKDASVYSNDCHGLIRCRYPGMEGMKRE